MPLQATSGAASYDAFGGGVPAVPNYIEEVFSTTLYTGNGSTQTITNGIDLSTKGGLVWAKPRSNTGNNLLFDTARGGNSFLMSNSTSEALSADGNGVTFNSNGFTGGSYLNSSNVTYASWSWAKAPKFFDIVTWSGNDASNRQITHNLGSVPGCIIVKTTGTATDWNVYHRSLGNTKALYLNLTQAQETNTNWGNTTPTSSVFTTNLNGAGNNYIAYLFAHDAGGFGLTGTDNVISCGSFTMASGVATVNLGYEPQWILAKSTGSSNWIMFDNMRGMPVSGTQARLLADFTQQEYQLGPYFIPSATGFTTSATGFGGGNNETYIYIAIRRGPMKVPTSGTSVYNGITRTATNSVANINGVGFPPDICISSARSAVNGSTWFDKLRGPLQAIRSPATTAEATHTNTLTSFNMDGISVGAGEAFFDINRPLDSPYVLNFMRRAPSFFDEVCYLGNGTAARNITHNLTVAPEFVIVKKRSGEEFWGTLYVATSSTGALNSTAGLSTSNNQYYFGNDTVYVAPTASVFTVGSVDRVNASGGTYVAYLFATCAGVSKVFSYTGNGSSQTINCGFTSGARFVLIKRTDSSGDWYVWDSARGIVSGNDPHLSLNTTAAEVTTDDTIDTDSTGFVVNQVSATDVNVSSATYIGLAIA